MPELRIDPIVGRRAYVAEDRAGRPNDFVDESLRAAPRISEKLVHVAESLRNSACPFCAGNEAHTPLASATVFGADGRWQVRVVPNKYPAVVLEASKDRAFGAHEVIIESPEHVTEVVDLGVEWLAVVLAAYRDRLRHWAADGRLKHAIVFKNSGCAAGASLEHVHSQLIALPFVPAAVQEELDGAARFGASHLRCVFCDLIERELAAGDRMVLRDGGYVAVAAYAPRQPYETWILPERHGAHFSSLTDADLGLQSRVLRGVLRRLDAVSPGVAYNLLLHTAPFDAAEGSYHWHWEVLPRLTHDAGVELGAGVYITPLSPERAAADLRGGRL